MKIENIIKELVKKEREKYDIGIYPRYIPKVCNECDRYNMMFADTNGFRHEQINTKKFGIDDDDLFHVSSLLGCNTENGPMWYLIDPTYGQFYEDDNFKEYMFNNHYLFSNNLLTNGYIEFDIETLFHYIDGFISVYNLDRELIYRKTDEYFKNIRLFNKDISLEDELYEYTRKRQIR